METSSTPTPTICWESSSATYTAPNGRVYDHTAIKNTTVEIIRLTWERYSNIKFIWQDGHGASCDVKVHLNYDGRSYVDEPGYSARNIYLNIFWMLPVQGTFDATSKSPPSKWWNASATSMTDRQNLQYDFLRELVIHEFGHVVGLLHEQNRDDAPDDASKKDGPDGINPIGAYDIYSVMNYDWLLQNQNPIPKLSCGDVATARFLYGPNPTYPNLAPKCTPQVIQAADPSHLAPDQYTSWVSDANLNSGTKTGRYADDFPRDNSNIVATMPGVYDNNGRYLNTRILITRTSGNPPGYNIEFSLVNPNPNPNDPSLSCSNPMKIPTIRLATIERPGGYSKWLPEGCNDNSSCQDILLPNVQLSACNPSKTVWIPAGKGTYNASNNSFTFVQCQWEDESLTGYVAETFTFGMVSNGSKKCVERNGLFSDFLFYINDDWISKAPAVSLPANYDRAIKFFLSMPEASSLPSSRAALSDGTRKYDYLISKHEVSQGEYHGVMKKLPFGHLGNLSMPAENISWFDAILYCNKKSGLESLSPVYTYQTASFDAQGNCTGLSNLSADHSKNGYRLPTVDEWKQAYRAGTTTFWYWPGSYPTSTHSPNHAWYWDNSGGEPHSVGQKIPNNWGLYDMGGNVSEWVWAEPGETYAYQMGGNTRDLEYNVNASGTMRVKSQRNPYSGFRVMRRVGSVQPALQFLLMD